MNICLKINYSASLIKALLKAQHLLPDLSAQLPPEGDPQCERGVY